MQAQDQIPGLSPLRSLTSSRLQLSSSRLQWSREAHQIVRPRFAMVFLTLELLVTLSLGMLPTGMLSTARAYVAQDAIPQLEGPYSEEPYSEDKVLAITARAKEVGSFDRGLKIYTRAKSACFSCHRIGSAGGVIGPELIASSKLRTPNELVESLLWPNRVIAKEFQPIKIVTTEGELISGYEIASESNDSVLAIQDPSTRSVTKLERSDIENQANGQSLMPTGLVGSLAEQELADLVRFLIDLGKSESLDLPAIESAIRAASTHEPTDFPLVAKPVNPKLNPAWTEHINRDRIYDFYTKQAIHFTASPEARQATMLTSFPGLDGASYGHWGNQNEAFWQGNEMNQAVQGSVLCNVLSIAPRPIARAVCIRLGQTLSLSACFNPDTLAYEKLWTGGFVKFSNVRHGLMDGVRIEGTEKPLPAEAGPLRDWMPQYAKSDIRYQGYYVYENQVLFLYSIDGVDFIDAPVEQSGSLKRIVAPKSTHPMRAMLKGGASQWPQVLETDISLGDASGFAVDTIALPFQNPWNTLLYCGDHAFMQDGTAILVTMQGDVWRVSGVAYDAQSPNKKASWRRIASGLHQPLGVVVRAEQIYVLGRNQITRLNDLNGDGETDWYECYSNQFTTSPGGHDYICGLQQDQEGNFYTASGNEGVVQIAADGKSSSVIATGLRNSDGLGILPDGTITVPASEGDWTPTSMIYQIQPKSVSSNGEPIFETKPPAFCGYRGPRPGQEIQLPLLYLPRGVDNSSGGQVWIDDSRMGPLDQSLVHTSFGTGRAMLILRDRVGEQWQGAAVVLPGEYRAGTHRARINPKDGMLYLSGMAGWGTYTPDSGCFQRLRYTGETVQLPTAFHVHENGVSVSFREPIDRETVENASAQFAQCWNYRYSPGYGSKEFSVLRAPMIGHDKLTVASSHVLEDGKTLFLELPDLQRCSQLHLRIQVGKEDWQELFATVHAMDTARTDLPSRSSQARSSQAKSGTNAQETIVAKTLLPHPMVRDLEWLQRSIPNPWRAKIEKSRPIRIEARDNLQYSTKVLECKAGEAIQLTFANPDVVPHNWALLRPNSLEKIGAMANGLVNDLDAYLRHYVPESKDVLCYTDIVEPKEEGTIYFVAPTEPGRYPFLCTFPGHWMVMNGELVVRMP